MTVVPTYNVLTPPAVIVNQAIVMLGLPAKMVGDIGTDGTPVAEAARYTYGQALRQLLRAAHWPFARKRSKLQLLGDATGNPEPDWISTFVEPPWGYAYAWPIDAVQGRWLPWSPVNNQARNGQGVPLTTGTSSALSYNLVPGRFLVTSSDAYPIETGVQPWDNLPDLQRTEGLGPTYRKIILTNCCDAHFVYTRFVPVIEEWDNSFRQAMVVMMAMALAPVAIEDPKLRLDQMARLDPVLRNTIADARVAGGNEAGMPQSVDHLPSWITRRNNAAWWGAAGAGGMLYGGGLGDLWCGWESMSWGGSVF